MFKCLYKRNSSFLSLLAARTYCFGLKPYSRFVWHHLEIFFRLGGLGVENWFEQSDLNQYLDNVVWLSSDFVIIVWLTADYKKLIIFNSFDLKVDYIIENRPFINVNNWLGKLINFWNTSVFLSNGLSLPFGVLCLIFFSKHVI